MKAQKVTAQDVVHVGERSGLRYVHIRPEMAEALAALELASHPNADPDHLYDAPALAALARDFPEGCFVGLDGDEIVAMGVGLRLDFDFDDPQHSANDIIPTDGVSSGHQPDGEWYYGTSIATRPSHRRRGIGTELYELRKQVCRDLNLRGIVAGGVIPGYADHKDEMTADEYICKVSAGELYDRTLSFQLENGFEAVCALHDYILNPTVDNRAALIVWHNPDHDAAARSGVGAS